MEKFCIDFYGFYESIHDSNIDSMLCNYFDDEDFWDKEELKINYKLIRSEYSKKWLESFKEFLEDEYEINVNFVFEGLISPTYYNFTTDKIEVSINEEDKKIIFNSVDDDIKAFIDEESKSHSGFSSFYEGYDEVIKDDEVYLQYIMRCFSDEFEKDYFSNYYDKNLIFELLNNFDFLNSENQ